MLDTLFAQLVLPDEKANDLSLAASLAPGGAAGDHTLLTLRFSPPAESAAPASRTVELVAVGRDADGTWTRPVRWSGEATAANGAYEVKIELAITPGSRVWSVGLRDTLTSLDGYAVGGAAESLTRVLLPRVRRLDRRRDPAARRKTAGDHHPLGRHAVTQSSRIRLTAFS